MINHVVLLIWKKGTSQAQVEVATQGFARLAETIGLIKGYSFGPNLGLPGSNFDYALVARFESIEDFNAYMKHPKHSAFMESVTDPIVESYGAVQYVS